MHKIVGKTSTPKWKKVAKKKMVEKAARKMVLLEKVLAFSSKT